jgi:hypothetical protein
MFDATLCTLLENFTTSPPQDKTQWYKLWNAILLTSFPRYIVTPLHRTAGDSKHTRSRYLLFEVSKLTKLPVESRSRTVLIVAVMHSPGPDWRTGIPLLETEINRQADIAFRGGVGGPAISKVYWVGVLGPHWQYGVKEDNGRELSPSIAWHDTTHDQASYDDFQHLIALLAEM